jgi:DNA repair protein RadC
MVLELRTELAVREQSESGPKLTSPEEVASFLREMKHMAQEAFVVIGLNAKNRVINKHLVSIGTVSSALVHPRECFRPVLLDCASSVILAHNHPSGEPTPSAEDIKITRQLVSAGEVLGIGVLDHVIIGNDHLSLREAGLVKF